MLKIRNWSILLLGIAAFALAGCNTMQGAGEDIESAGDAIQDAAD
ncbi:MAG: entericidin A/B family lipoprotein [Phycisphaerales bacterium JB063]